MAQPGWIKAVNQINWCGSIGAGIIGCAPVPGSSLAVVRFSEALEGILWAHEFGHNKGRSHRVGTANVMHPSIGADRLGVDAAECAAFRTLPATGAEAALILAAGGEGASETHEAVEAPEDVREFVRQHFVHGVPYEVARRYGPEDVPALVAMLEDPAESEWWTNAVAVIGMIGEDEAFEPLVAFMEAERGEMPAEVYRAVSTVPLALGYLANQAESERALDYLVEAARPEFWEERALGTAEFQPSTQARDMALATQARLGLALSGAPEAAQALEALAEAGGEGVAGADDGVIDEALAANRRIAEDGLEAYYER